MPVLATLIFAGFGNSSHQLQIWDDLTHPYLATSSICQLWQNLSQVARLPKMTLPKMAIIPV